MNKTAQIIGERIREYRNMLGLTQEQLAEKAGCHPSYVGQLERGEKNATIESIEKISSALNVSLSTLFELSENTIVNSGTPNFPLLCYEYVLGKTPTEQEQFYKILTALETYKNN